MPFIVNDLGKYVDDKYKNRTMINEMKAFYNFENRIRRIHKGSKRYNPCTYKYPQKI